MKRLYEHPEWVLEWDEENDVICDSQIYNGGSGDEEGDWGEDWE